MKHFNTGEMKPNGNPLIVGKDWPDGYAQKTKKARVDGKLVDVPKYPIPNGWTEVSIAEVAELTGPTEAEQRELDRLTAKRNRDQSLQAITHHWPDGSVVQVRPQDLANFQVAIQRGESQRWVLADNTTRLTTVTDLESALADGIAQAEVIWSDYADALDALNSD